MKCFCDTEMASIKSLVQSTKGKYNIFTCNNKFCGLIIYQTVDLKYYNIKFGYLYNEFVVENICNKVGYNGKLIASCSPTFDFDNDFPKQLLEFKEKILKLQVFL